MSADGDAVGIYGQKPQPEETPEFVSRMHARLEEELEKLPDDLKAGWVRAKEKCPELVGEDHRLMFLRCEVFNADVSGLAPVLLEARIVVHYFIVHFTQLMHTIICSWQPKGSASIGTSASNCLEKRGGECAPGGQQNDGQKSSRCVLVVSASSLSTWGKMGR